MAKHYGDKDGLKVLSRNAILNIINSGRNYGKTWTFKRRAVRRAFKHGKKTLWLRLFKSEVKECIDTFFTSRDLQKYCGIELYDPTTKKGNVRQIGNTFYYRKSDKSKWEWFIKVFLVSAPDAVRSADDVMCDTIIVDEYAKTSDRMSKYRGNMVNHFLDIFFSAKREHKVFTFMLGNNESISNPVYSYFRITPPPSNWEGIRMYRKGSILVQQINNVPDEKDDYDKKLNAMLEGTPYGNFIYKGATKGATGLKTRKTPNGARLWVQLYIKGHAIKISSFNGFFYANSRIEESKPIYCDSLPHKYPLERVIVNRMRNQFRALTDAINENRLYFDSELCAEAFRPFMKWLGTI